MLPAGSPPEYIMGFLSLLQRVLGFTQSEIRALLFLAATFLLGLGIRWFQANDRADPATHFDYSVQDSIFSERSRKELADRPMVETGKGRKSRPSKQLRPHSININTASKDELMLLPGIGETYAERIVIHRQDHGRFRSIDELSKVKGIGKKTLVRIRDFIRPIDSTSTTR